ncbi:MAG: hypothetical protein PHY00_01995 [Bacilli bacterium]|nr:hypothetical protein [Bacilli bacterium]
MKNKIVKIFTISGINILIWIFGLIFFSSLGFIFKISINIIPLILTILLILIYNIVLLKKYDSQFIIVVLSIFISFLSIIFSIVISQEIHDLTWDGNDYHKLSIGALKNGWNPLYDDVDNWYKNNSDQIQFSSTGDSYVWSNSYAKASWIYGANVYYFTENIESGKSINLLSLLSLFLISLGYFSKRGLFKSLVFSTLVCLTPLFVMQLFTNYIDMLIGIYLFLLIFSLIIMYLDDDELFLNKIIIYVIAMILLINLKFTGFAFAGIYCLGFYIYFTISDVRNNTLIKTIRFTIVSVVALCIGVFLIGSSTYLKNYFNHGNPMYPLFGENKKDIMTANSPAYFKNKSGIEKFIIANFSEGANISKADGKEAKLKIPFTISENEKRVYSSAPVDMRIGGFGPLFGGILIISVLFIIACEKKLYLTNKKMFYSLNIPLLINFILIFTLSDIWWARYFPQLYLTSLISILILEVSYKTKISKFLKTLLLIILFYNTFVYGTLPMLKLAYKNNKKIREEYSLLYEYIETNNITTLKIYTRFEGEKYNLRDKLEKLFNRDFNYLHIDVNNDFNDYTITHDWFSLELGMYHVFMKNNENH